MIHMKYSQRIQQWVVSRHYNDPKRTDEVFYFLNEAEAQSKYNEMSAKEGEKK